MRKIKFRAFLKSNQTMYDVLILDIIDNKVLINNEEKQLRGYVKYQDVELMQYTGLKDANGKDIYEGDIISFGDNKGVVFYKHAKFRIKYRYHNNCDCSCDCYEDLSEVLYYNKVQIIGNVYENKELLKGEE